MNSLALRGPAGRSGPTASVRHRRWELTLAVAGLVALPGCLAPSYVVTGDALAKMRNQAPAERGREIRVVQRFVTAQTPRPAEAWPGPPPGATRSAEAHADGDMNGAMWWWWIAPPGPPMVQPQMRAAQSVGASSGVVDGGGNVQQGAGRGGSSLGGGLGSASSAVSTSGTDTGKALVVVAAAAVVVGIGLAATEGARYDGWVSVHPAHPVHITNGRAERVVPLWQLVDEPLADDEEAVIVRHEGAGMWLNGRAPLNRVGFSYGFDVSSQQMALDDGDVLGLSGTTLEFGFWPAQWGGVQISTLMGWGNDRNGLAVARVQPRIELNLVPIRLWRLHIGGLAAWGWNVLARDATADDASTMVSSLGPLLQFDLTTRLALTVKWQWSWDHGRNEANSTAVGLGLSIY